jgi:hypothetical protein
MIRSSLRLAPLVAIFAFACGGPAEPVAAPAASSAPATKPATDAQLKLAHFTTADGMIGFVLDRSGTPIKLQVDGDKDIVELTQQEDRDSRGELVGYRFVDPTDTLRISISTYGSITFHRGKDALPASSDKEAAPLGEPTIKGPPVKKAEPPPPYAELAAKLSAASVRVKMPEMTAKDAADLAKVEAAIAKADASMFVHYRKPGADGWGASFEEVPRDFGGFAYGGGDFATDDDEAKRYVKYAEHGGRLVGVSSPERDLGNHILSRRTDKRHELADKTPAIVWEVDDSYVTLVTLDGARYVVSLSQGSSGYVPVGLGAGPEGGWPKPLADTYVDVTIVSGWTKAGAYPQKAVDELSAIDDAWNVCVAKGWKPTRTAMGVNYRAKAVEVHKGCRKHMQDLEKALVTIATDRAKARKALFDKAAARVREVGAAK